MHTHTHTHTHTHMYIHIYIHTHTHIHTHISFAHREDERPMVIAKALGVDVDKLVALNKARYPTLNKV